MRRGTRVLFQPAGSCRTVRRVTRGQPKPARISVQGLDGRTRQREEAVAAAGSLLRLSNIDICRPIERTNWHKSAWRPIISSSKPLHPARQRLLIFGSSRLGFANIAALLGGAILADLELALDARNGDAEAHDAGQHGAPETLRHRAPSLGI